MSMRNESGHWSLKFKKYGNVRAVWWRVVCCDSASTPVHGFPLITYLGPRHVGAQSIVNYVVHPVPALANKGTDRLYTMHNFGIIMLYRCSRR